MQAIADTAIAFHEVDNMPRVLPAALGAVQTTVLQEAGAYASIDEGGREVTPTLIDSVQDRDGQVVWRPERSGLRRLWRSGQAAAGHRRPQADRRSAERCSS